MSLFGSSKTNPFADIQENIEELVNESRELETIDQKEVQGASSSEVKQKFQEEGKSVEELVEDIRELEASKENEEQFLHNLVSLMDELAEVVRLHILMVTNEEIPEYQSYEKNGDTAAANTKEQEIEGKLIILEAMLGAALNVCQDAGAIAESHGDEQLHNAVRQRVERFSSELEKVQGIEK